MVEVRKDRILLRHAYKCDAGPPSTNSAAIAQLPRRRN
jgi:hypothetical protein